MLSVIQLLFVSRLFAKTLGDHPAHLPTVAAEHSRRVLQRLAQYARRHSGASEA